VHEVGFFDRDDLVDGNFDKHFKMRLRDDDKPLKILHRCGWIIGWFLLALGSAQGQGQQLMGQRFFRKPADSVQYETLRQQILENLSLDIKSNNDAITKKSEKLLIKVTPGYQFGRYAFYEDLQRTNRPDTITHLGLYVLEGRGIPEKVAACVNLKELDISGCDVRELPAWLGQLRHLETLTIAKSGLKRLKVHVGQLPSLREVNLPYNELRRIPRGLLAFDSVEGMNLSGNRLKTMPRFLGLFQRLAYLNLGYNHFRRNRMKSNMTVKSINLSHNGLESMPFSLAGFNKLISLNLSYNSIARIQNDLGGHELRVVNLYNNRLNHIPGNILKQSGIMNLDLSHNEITSVPAAIAGMKDLNVLSLWDNEVKELPYELSRLPRLSTLYFQDNQLADLPDSLSRLPLVKLDVGYNRLTRIPPWVFQTNTIEELYVNNNDVAEIAEGILTMSSLRVLYIFGNPFSDNPDLKRIVKALRDRNVDVRQ
jgi:Leucine-rich repeat (LRR) protein